MEKKKSIRPTVLSLPCELTSEEYTQRAERLVAIMQEIANTKTQLEEIKKSHAERLKQLEGTRIELGKTLHSRIEHRDVKCVVEKARETGTEVTTRLDTGEVVKTRALTLEEMQEDLLQDDEG